MGLKDKKDKLARHKEFYTYNSRSKKSVRIEYYKKVPVKKTRIITSDFQVQKTKLKLEEISKTVRKLRASMGGFASSKKRGSKKKFKSVKKDYKTFRRMEIETKILLKAYEEETPRKEEYEDIETKYFEEEFVDTEDSSAYAKMVARYDSLMLEDLEERPQVSSP